MEIVIIACLDSKGVIGCNGSIPWDLPEDRQRFRNLTYGHGVVMGRRTYESIGHPLEGRTNYILSRQRHFQIEGGKFSPNIPTVLKQAEIDGVDPLFVIGGAAVYEQFFPIADRMELTILSNDFYGDAYFPNWEKDRWLIDSEIPGTRPHGDLLEHRYVRYLRIT